MATEQANDVRDEIEALRARLGELEARVEDESPASESLSRRRFFTAAGAAAAAGVAGTMLGAAPAGATQGTWDFGTSGNDAGGDPTTLTSTSAASTLNISNSGTGNAIGAVNTGGTGHGLVGVASGTGVGVRAENPSPSGLALQAVGDGTGVQAVAGSATGFGVTASNNVAGGTGVRGTNSVSGAPSTGVLGEITGGGSGGGFGVRGVTDAVNTVGVQAENSLASGATVALRATVASNTDGTPIAIQGTATANTGTGVSGTGKFGVKGATSVIGGYGVHGTSSAVTGIPAGVLGEATGITGPGIGVMGASAGDTGVGVQGEPTHASGAVTGVWGRTASTAGTGVLGETTAATGDTIGVHGTATSTDGGIGVKAQGAFAPLLLVSAFSATGAPVSTGHEMGEMYVDANGDLWFCRSDNDDWTKLNDQGTSPGPAPSEFVPLAAPERIYYSLTAGDPLLASDQERSVAVTNGTTIPHSATAVLTNLAVTPSSANGFLAMFKDGTGYPGHSNLNYTAGQFASNNATSAVSLASPAKVTIRCGGGSVHFVIDVLGYYT
jgi:hypothetical protein